MPRTTQTCRRWVDGAIAYATAMDDISAELVAAHRRAGSVPQWRRFAAPLALRNWEKTQQRYERVIQEASEAYQSIRGEIWQAIKSEKTKAAEHAQQAAEAHRRRAELAERPVCWSSVATNGRPTAHISRYDVSAGGRPAPTSPQVNGPVDLPGLRQALKVLKPVQLEWDSTAITETERELEGVSFESWWRELFSEDYRTFTSPPPSPSSSRPPRSVAPALSEQATTQAASAGTDTAIPQPAPARPAHHRRRLWTITYVTADSTAFADIPGSPGAVTGPL